MRWILHTISKLGYETYMTEFGGETADMLPHRPLGWAIYIASIEPDVGYPLLRALDDQLPASYNPDGADLGGLVEVVDLEDWVWKSSRRHRLRGADEIPLTHAGRSVDAFTRRAPIVRR